MGFLKAASLFLFVLLASAYIALMFNSYVILIAGFFLALGAVGFVGSRGGFRGKPKAPPKQQKN